MIHRKLGESAESALSRYSGKEMADLIENSVWHDLQMIRINGSLIGAFLGGLSYIAFIGYREAHHYEKRSESGYSFRFVGIGFCGGICCSPAQRQPVGVDPLFLTQSAFIGSAADWFAVTALFKRPLGFPFHTELIPRHRERLIRGIRRIIEENWYGRNCGKLWPRRSAPAAGSKISDNGEGTETAEPLDRGRRKGGAVPSGGEAGDPGFFCGDICFGSAAEIRSGNSGAVAVAGADGKFLQGLLQGGNVLLAQPEIKAGLERALKDFVEMQKKIR